MFARLRSFWQSLRHRAQFENELDEEMRSHIEARADDLVRSGLSRDEATRRARVEFGCVEAHQDGVRESRRVNWFEDLAQDLRFGLRMLRKSPGFTAVAVLTLALGIGANTAIFSVVYGVLLRPLPYPQPEQIAQISVSYKGEMDYSGFTAHEFDFWKLHSEPFAFLAASHGLGFNLTGGSESMRVRALRVSSAYLDVMGVQPALGRNFSREEDSPTGPDVVILGYGLWKSHFGGNAGILGKTISLNGTPFTVVGIVPSGFQSQPQADVWTTLAQEDRTTGSGFNYHVVGRLKNGVSRERADAYLESVSPLFLEQFRTHMISPEERPLVAFRATPLAFVMAMDYRKPLFALFGSIGFVLLIACVNVANLLLARSATRTREIAVRAALGARRSRVVRQFLSESLLLAGFGGLLGLLFAHWGLNLLLGLAPPDLPRAHDIALDAWALAFSIIVSVVCGIVFGTAPALRASKTNWNEALKESAGRASAGLGRQRMGNVLLVAEVALSLVLLAGASLLIETFFNLLRTNPGFDPHPVLSVQIWPTGGEFPSAAAMTNFDRSVTQRVESIPGVQSAAIVNGGSPLEQGGNEYVEFVGSKQRGLSSDYREVTPQYFSTLGVPLQRGRFFTDSDSVMSRNVAIINKEMVRERFANDDPIGKHVKIEDSEWEIVGVVGDVRSFLNAPAPPTVFLPDAQCDIRGTKGFLAWFPDSVLVRTAQDPLSVSKDVVDVIQAVDPAVPVGQVQSMDEILSTSLAFQRFLMTLMSTFAGLALVLAAVGMYGVMTYSVAQRTHEIGIRVALGARPFDVWRIVIGRGMLLTLAGVVVGLAGAEGLTRLLADQLYGVQPADLLVLTIAASVLALVALVACWIPARRAMRVDPMVALRHE
jgi:putative ABC transport system permease protein